MTISEELIYQVVIVLQPLWVHSSSPIYNTHQTSENDTMEVIKQKQSTALKPIVSNDNK